MGLRAALLAATTAAALGIASIGAPGASASLDCGGSAIQGAGSSSQELAQEALWGPGFNGAEGVCPGGPSITRGAGAWSQNCEPAMNDYIHEYIVRPAGQADLDTEYYSPLPSAGVDWRDVISAAVFWSSKTSW